MPTTKAEQLERVLDVYEKVETILSKVARLRNRLGYLVLGLSAFTSGSLWLLLSERVPRAALCAGAITSTLVTLITLYVHSAGLSHKRTEALSLFRDVTQLIAKIRTAPLPDEEFWAEYKRFDFRLTKLRYGQHGEDI